MPSSTRVQHGEKWTGGEGGLGGGGVGGVVKGKSITKPLESCMKLRR